MFGSTTSIGQIIKQLNQALPQGSRSSTQRVKNSQNSGTVQIRLPKWNKPQKQAWRVVDGAKRRSLTLAWGRGVGKSYFIRQLAWILVARHDGKLRDDALEPFKGVRIIFLCPTLKQWRDINAGGIEQELSGKWAALGGKINHSTWRIDFPGGSWIQPFPAAEYNARKGRGMRCDVILSDEVDDIEAAVYDSVCSPWFSEPWSFGLEIFSGTPRRGRHGLLFRNFEAGRKGQELRSGLTLATNENEQLKKYFAFKATYKDAPGNVSAEEVAKAQALMMPSTFSREYEADFDSGEGLVYPFDSTFHVRKPPPLAAFSEFIVGVDWGYVDPACLLLIGIMGHGNDATAWVLSEFYETGCPDDRLQAKAKSWQFAQTFYCDPSQPKSIDMLKRVVNATKADNDIEGGTSRVASLVFKRTVNGQQIARLYVAPECRNTIKEFGLYVRKRDPLNPEGFLESPLDKSNHAMDALRYAIVGRFGRGHATKGVVSGR